MVLLNRAFVGLAGLMAFGLAKSDFDGPAPIAWRWADRIEARPSGAPTIMGNRVYAAVGSRMYCLDRETGNQVWRFPSGEPLQANFTTGGIVTGKLMIAAADDKSVYAINIETGEMAWQYVAPDSVFARPVVAGNSVVIGLASNQLVALDTLSGKPVWDAPYSVGSGIYDSMASWQGVVYFLSSDGNLNAVDISAKRPAWRPRQFSSVGPLSGIAVYGDNLYVTAGSYLTSLTASAGRLRWEALVPGVLRFSAAAGPEGVVCVTDDGRMHSYNNSGRPAFRTGIDLNSSAVASPTFTGKMVVIPTSNGALNLIDPFSGQIVWNFTVPPMIKGMKMEAPSGGGNARGGAGGRGGNTGGPAGGGGSGGTQQKTEIDVKSVAAAGSAAVEGDTLVLLVEDGSILLFDKGLGVDLTAPEVSMMWPNAGDQVSGRAPMELVFTVSDAGSGVNFDRLHVSVNGQEYVHEIDRDGRVRVKIVSSNGPNQPLTNGRARITVAAEDWMENSTSANFVLTIDNTLPPLGSPKAPDTGAGKSGGRGGGGSAGGGR